MPSAWGDYYPAIAARRQAWFAELDPERTALVISHGITLRFLRGPLAGDRAFEGVMFAEDAPQGTVFRLEDGVAAALHVGAGHAGVMTLLC